MQPAAGRSVDWVEQFVREGGGVLVLGGNVSFGMSSPGGKINESSMVKWLPAAISDNADIDVKAQNRPFTLRPAVKHPILKSVSFADRPITLFYHKVKPKPDAEVILKAGDAPVMIVGTYGKGRVAIFLATLHGDPANDVTPYWTWAGWPKLVRNTVDWLAAK